MVFSFNRYKTDPKSSKDVVQYIASVTAKDKYTVVFKMNAPMVTQLGAIGWGSANLIQPREVVEKYGNMEDWRNNCGG
ncbi:MAG: hypothetical protein MUO99_08680 [Dehalococcoidales bacterium]|nr:hypothetical protein [Dehalococcoidales bacterium]